MANLNETLMAYLRDEAYVPQADLATYHHVQAIKNALRKKEDWRKLADVRQALKQYRVHAYLADDGRINLECDDKKSITIGNARKGTPPTSKFVAAVRAHAEAHYGQGGWDILVECWEDAQISEEIGAARTVAGAIKNVAKCIDMLGEHRAEIRATAF